MHKNSGHGVITSWYTLYELIETSRRREVLPWSHVVFRIASQNRRKCGVHGIVAGLPRFRVWSYGNWSSGAVGYILENAGLNN